MSVTVVVLCAGFGSRLGGVIKPMIEVGGRPLLHWTLEWAAGVSADRVAVVTNAAHHERYIDLVARLGVAERVVLFCDGARHAAERRGTIGSFARAQQGLEIGTDVLLLAGDNLFRFDPAVFVTHAASAPYDLTLAVTELRDAEQARRYGVVVTDRPDATVSRITRFTEKPMVPFSRLVATGCVFLRAFALGHVAAYVRTCEAKRTVPDAFGHFIEQAFDAGLTFGAYRFTGPWYDVGDAASREAADALMQQRRET